MKRATLPALMGILLLSACTSSDRGPASMGGSEGPAAPFGLDPARLAPSVDVADMMIVTDGRRDTIGVAVSTVEYARLGGHSVLRFVLDQRFRMSEMVDTLEVDPATLRPIRYRNAMGEIQSIMVDYAPDGRVSSRATRMGETTARDTVMAGDFLDAAEFQPMISALPLADGYRATIPVYHYEAGPDSVRVRVVGRSRLPYGGMGRDVWLVEYEGAPGRVVTLAIDTETRRMLRADSRMDGERSFEQVTR